MTDEKGKSGVGRADGEVEGVIAPAGTWWRTCEPGDCEMELQTVHRFADLSHDGNACRIWP